MGQAYLERFPGHSRRLGNFRSEVKMFRSRRPRTLFFTLLALAFFSPVPAGHAGFLDKVKDKVKEAKDKVPAKPDESSDKPAEEGDKSSAAAGASTDSKGGSAGMSAVSTKFDYVPGDSVIFLDDFTQDDLGEFPARWSLKMGTFETAEMAGERWLRCAGDDGTVRMKLPGTLSLPEFWTLEFDYYDATGGNNGLTARGVSSSGQYAWEVIYPYGNAMAFFSGELFGSAPYEGAGTVAGRHHLMLMARGKALKAYVDRQRAVNIPEIFGGHGMPTAFEFRFWSVGKPMITNVRFAEGCRPAKDMLAEGKLVTYGIHFESGSDVVQPESAPVLRQIAAYLVSKPNVKLKITGHTDNVGKASANLDLSRRRAAAVASVLTSQFDIAADRFKTDGKGDTQPLSTNAKAEGRAMNRRVEFVRIEG
jgi:hypothetical protein